MRSQSCMCAVGMALLCLASIPPVSAQIRSRTPAQDALKAVEGLIGTWTGEGASYEGFGEEKRDGKLQYTFRFRWLQNRTAVEFTSEVRNATTGKRHNAGSKIMSLDAASGQLRVVGYGYEDDVYFSNSGAMRIEKGIITLSMNESTIHDSKASYTVCFSRPKPDSLFIQMKDVVIDSQKQKDFQITVHRQKPVSTDNPKTDSDAGGRSSRIKTTVLDTELVPGSVEVAVLLPPGYQADSPPYCLLLWLHGGPGDCSYLNRELRPVIEAAWNRKELGPLIVATPSARRSFYMDYQDGSEKWETLILKQLIPTLRQKYNLRDDQKGTLIGGYSMGGMGSLRMAFKHPEHFAAVASIAPAIEPTYRFQDIEPRDREHRTDAIFERTYGKPVDRQFWQANHPPTLARDHAGALKKSNLKIYFECGDADDIGLFRGAEFLHDTLLKNNVAHEYRLVHGAAHEDDTLPARLADAMRFFGRVTETQKPHAELQAHMDRYFALFNAGDAEAIARDVYAAPVMRVNPETAEHYVIETTEDLQKHIVDLRAGIKARGWARSIIHDTEFRLAGPDMVIASITFSRLRANGETIPPARRIATYFYLKTAEGWRMIFVYSQPESDQQAPPGTADEIRKLMGQYIDHLNGDQPAVDVTDHIYEFPFLSRSFMGARQHSVKMSKELTYKSLDGYLKLLKAKGLNRFVVDDLKIHVVSKTLAFVDMYSRRLRKDGTAIPPGRTGFTYIWMKKPTGWRMIGTLAHGESDNHSNPVRKKSEVSGKAFSIDRLDWLTGRTD